MNSKDNWSNLIRKITFFSLTGTGTAGNSFLFVKHLYTLGVETKKKGTDFIVIQLAFANAMTLLASGIAHIRSPFHFHYFLGDVGCKVVIFLGRVSRGLSLCTTCLLSVVQAITISPLNTSWTKLKPQKKWQVLSCLLLFWFLNFLISSNLLYYIRAVNSINRSVIRIHVGYCYMMPSRQIVRWLFLSLMTLRDIIFQSFMGCSSGYMAVYLYEHHKRVLYLHSSRSANESYSRSANQSPEIRATLSILILMTYFLFFYWADFVFSFYTGSTVTHEFTILNIKIFLGLGYAILSPIVLISRDAHMVKCWHRHRESAEAAFYTNSLGN